MCDTIYVVVDVLVAKKLVLQSKHKALNIFIKSSFNRFVFFSELVNKILFHSNGYSFESANG